MLVITQKSTPYEAISRAVKIYQIVRKGKRLFTTLKEDNLIEECFYIQEWFLIIKAKEYNDSVFEEYTNLTIKINEYLHKFWSIVDKNNSCVNGASHEDLIKDKIKISHDGISKWEKKTFMKKIT